MSNRSSAADALKAVKQAVTLWEKTVVFERNPDPGNPSDNTTSQRLIESERSTRSLWQQLAAAGSGVCYGSAQLTVARANATFCMGQYKFMEGLDAESVALYHEADEKLSEVLTGDSMNPEVQATQDRARKIAGRLKIHWGMSLQILGEHSNAIKRYKEGLSFPIGSTFAWVRNDRIPQCERALGKAPADADDVSFVGESTREDRDAEGRKRAINLEFEPTSRKQAKAEDFELRVAQARSLCDAEVDAKYKALLQPYLDAFTDDQIDGTELQSRKAEVRQAASKQHAPLEALTQAYAAYQATATRLEAAQKAHEDAETHLEAQIRAIQPAASGSAGGAAGSSGVVKGR